ncbi:MAG: glycosyltransferase family 1 protein [Moorea sp. SIO3G5]|nr:glycosyltransferase family 1 protein [Moorena sp. SIO3G5]
MKIAIITSGFLPVIDGVTVSGLSRLQRLSQWGHQVLLFCPDYSALEHVYPNWRDYTGQILPGVRIINLPSTSFMDLDFERQVRRSSYSILLQELKKFQPDIIHVDEPERLFFGFFRVPGVAFAKKAGIPCVCFFRTNFLDYAEDYFSLPSVVVAGIKFIFKTILISVYNSYDITLVSSRITHKKIINLGIKNTLHANLVGFDASKFYPGLREEQFFEKNYDLRGVEGKVKLIFLGRLTPDKGWKFTLNAFSRVVQEVNSEQIALIIAGDGSMRDEIATGLSQLTPNSHFLGRVPPENVPALLINSDIHITASEKETRGLTILEAFAAGIPVLAPEAGGVVENIQDGWNGFLFTPQNQEDFCDKLKVLIESPALRQEMGRNGRECVSQYGWDQRVQNLVAIWEKQIAKKTH